ncbi:Crp/Fnr family transcriptional regulator [Tissierella sp.]|uniref:Crp/Fnr family transcriptional regulator n=1 Tax=Tissierella sp. TaxID=41274 RepID=UPI0028AC1E7A|nr:Crp/Fnr family transcriptional regulator [Tissierella sp.]
MDCSCFNREGKNCIEIVPIFSNLSYEEMMEVARITREKTFEKGEMLYMAGEKSEKLYVIHSGKVKITRFTDTGKEQVIRVLGSGDFMGELSLFSPLPLTDNGEALSRTIACMIDGKKLKDLMKKYPVIAFKIMEELSQRLEKAEDLIENISLYGVERRLALTLINMANEKGEVSLRMSKKDFASHLGMSQETLSRKLTFFQNMGIIKLIGHRRIILLDIEALRQIE